MKKIDKNNSLKESINIEIKEEQKRVVRNFKLSLGQKQKDFITSLLKKTNLRIGELVWQSVLYANSNNIDNAFLIEHINFIHDKKHGIEVQIQKRATSHENLREAREKYKSLGYNFGLKGVVLLYLLYYAQNHLKMNIKKYSNFN